MGVTLVERPEEHALGAPILGDAEVFRVRPGVAGRRCAQHVGVQPKPGQGRLAHASNGLNHANRARVGGEPFRQPLALGDAPGEVGLQQVGVDEVGREPLACLWKLVLGHNPTRRFGRGRFKFGRLGGLLPLSCCVDFCLFLDPLLHIDPNEPAQPVSNCSPSEAPQPIGLKGITGALPEDLSDRFRQRNLD